MIYQFEYEGFNVCGDCPCWCPDIISEGYATAEGCCYINFEKRNRFTEKPIDCPLLIVSKADKEIGKESLQALLAAEKRKIVRCNECKHVNYSGCGGKTDSIIAEGGFCLIRFAYAEANILAGIYNEGGMKR